MLLLKFANALSQTLTIKAFCLISQKHNSLLRVVIQVDFM